LKNYDSHDNAFIWNGAIGNNTSLILYRIKPKYYEVFKKRYLLDSPSYRVPSGFTSSIKDHVIRHAKGNLPPDILLSEAIEEIEVPCTCLENLLISLDFEFEKVDILQIDTEGMDDLVIYSSNIESLRPSLINFEHSNLPVIRLEALYEYLINLNYKIYKWSTSDTVAIKL
jgi:hypothetical protein